jgi:putative DNA primase/helicase
MAMPELQPREKCRLEFADALQAAGLVLGGLPVMDGKLHRVRVEGDKAGARPGAYVGHLDGHPSGFIQNFRAGLKENWKSQLPREALSAADRARLLAEAAERKRIRDEQRREIAVETARLVEAHLDGMPQLGARAARADHPYLERKRIGAHGVYLNTAGPLSLLAGEERPQMWQPTAESRSPAGAVIVGGHHLIGEVAAGCRSLKGYSTAATLHEATGLPVAVAFHAGNIEPVAPAYRDRFPDLHIYIAGYNDHRAERELGADGKPRGMWGGKRPRPRLPLWAARRCSRLSIRMMQAAIGTTSLRRLARSSRPSLARQSQLLKDSLPRSPRGRRPA